MWAKAAKVRLFLPPQKTAHCLGVEGQSKDWYPHADKMNVHAIGGSFHNK